MSWQWHEAEVAEAAEYARRVRKNQPQYDYVTGSLVQMHIESMRGYARYYLGENERGDMACFRLLLARATVDDAPVIDQYGVDGPNWLTAFVRGVPAVRDWMNVVAPQLSKELGRTIPPYDLGEVLVKTDDLQDRPAGRLLADELEKLTTGDTVVSVRPDSNERSKHYRMVRGAQHDDTA